MYLCPFCGRESVRGAKSCCFCERSLICPNCEKSLIELGISLQNLRYCSDCQLSFHEGEVCSNCEKLGTSLFPWIVKFPDSCTQEDLEYFQQYLPTTIMGVLCEHKLGNPEPLEKLVREYQEWIYSGWKRKARKDWSFNFDDLTGSRFAGLNNSNLSIFIALISEAFSEQCSSFKSLLEYEEWPVNLKMIGVHLTYILERVRHNYYRSFAFEDNKEIYLQHFSRYKQHLIDLFSYPLKSLQKFLAWISSYHLYYNKRDRQLIFFYSGSSDFALEMYLLRRLITENLSEIIQNYSKKELNYLLLFLMPKTPEFLCRFLGSELRDDAIFWLQNWLDLCNEQMCKINKSILKKTAKSFGLKGYSKWNKDQLIRSISDFIEENPCRIHWPEMRFPLDNQELFDEQFSYRSEMISDFSFNELEDVIKKHIPKVR